MARKLTQKEAVAKARQVHGNKYKYGEYFGSKRQWNIRCPKHNWFSQAAKEHFKGAGCRKCGSENVGKTQTITQDDAISKARDVHGGKYEYGKYNKSKEKWRIKCPNHGWFEQLPSHHFRGSGCPRCGDEKVSKFNSIDQDSAILKARKIHGNKYEYGKYKGSKKNWDIKCPNHGWFKQLPTHHFKGSGCRKCSDEQNSLVRQISQKQAIEKANHVHKNKYEYGKFNGHAKKWDIKCKSHGWFKQTANTHFSGSGCPKCKATKGEKHVSDILEELKIPFHPQKPIRCGKKKHPYRLDFYFRYNNRICAIEYDGDQHFNPISRFGGLLGFEDQKKRDALKNQYCLENSIHLIRIDGRKYKDYGTIMAHIVSRLP